MFTFNGWLNRSKQSYKSPRLFSHFGNGTQIYCNALSSLSSKSYTLKYMTTYTLYLGSNFSQVLIFSWLHPKLQRMLRLKRYGRSLYDTQTGYNPFTKPKRLGSGETKNSKIRGFEFAQFALSLVITNQISIIIFLPAVLKLNISGDRGCFLWSYQ